jgi:hypothetical protein
MARTDWPLGPALEKARIRAGLSVRAAARRTHGAISSGRWYQLESGVQKAKGQEIPVGTTAATVAAAALAVDWDIDEALRVAGFDPRDYTPQKQQGPLQQASIDELLSEIRRRFEEAGLADNPKAGRTPLLRLSGQDPSVDGGHEGAERKRL